MRKILCGFLLAAALPTHSGAVTVSGEAPLVDTASTSIGTVVTRELILQLPTARNFNELLTLSVTPGEAVGDPAPGVVRESVKMPNKKFTLPEGTKIGFGNGNELPLASLYTYRPKPTDKPFTITIRLPGEKKPVVEQTLKLPSVNPSSGPAFDFPVLPPNQFETPPIGVVGRLHVIRGSLSGDGGNTKVRIGDQLMKIVSENPRSVFFEIPDTLSPGNFRLTLENDGRRAEFPITLLQLSMSADQTKLKRGQTTKFHATITGPESWSDAAWKPGSPADLCDIPGLTKKFPGFHPPAPDGEGFILFSITNLSAGVVSIEEFARPLAKSQFAKGPYSYDGNVLATGDGGFGIHGEVQAFVAAASATSTPIPPEQKK